MTVAILGQQKPDDRRLCGSELKSIFDLSHADPTRHRVGLLFGMVENLAQLADELLKLVDFQLTEDESESHIRASRLARELGSVLREAAVQPPSLDERSADDELQQTAKSEHSQDDKTRSLTPRQREVLELLVKGMSNKEIARTLGLGEGTVKIHMSGLFRALGVNNRAGAAFVGAQMIHQ